MKWQGVAYRGHDPRWSWKPLSGEGARLKGGRFNPVGMPALYLASSLEGVFAEMSHGFSQRMEPLTICEYHVDCDNLIDLRTADSRIAARVSLPDLSAPWRYHLANGRYPRSWQLVTKLYTAGASGILVPSFARTAKPDSFNFVLWRWGAELPHKVTVHDPSGRLPKSDLSWQ